MKISDAISKLEYDLEENIYKLMRNEHVIHNYYNASIFSLPPYQGFVYYHRNDKQRHDSLEKSIGLLHELLEKPNGFLQDDKEIMDLLPYEVSFFNFLKIFTKFYTFSYIFFYFVVVVVVVIVVVAAGFWSNNKY